MTADQRVELWDARFQIELAAAIGRYLSEHPPPSPSRLASDAAYWAENLSRDGRERLLADEKAALEVLDGDGLSADDAAWALIADATDQALGLPALTAHCAAGTREGVDGVPPRRRAG